MHRTRLPLRTWFWAAYLVSTFQPGISAKQLQRQLGLGCHETAWVMLHKLRGAMVAPEREPLKGEVEIDEFFLGGHEEGLKGGRQRGKKALVRRRDRGPRPGLGAPAPAVLPNSRAKTLVAFTKATTAPGAIVHTDGLLLLQRAGQARLRPPPAQSASAEPASSCCRASHRAISNLKAWMHGTHRGVSDEHLQVYLDEYVFRHNRRRTPMAGFQTLLGLGSTHEPTTYRQIIDRAA